MWRLSAVRGQSSNGLEEDFSIIGIRARRRARASEKRADPLTEKPKDGRRSRVVMLRLKRELTLTSSHGWKKRLENSNKSRRQFVPITHKLTWNFNCPSEWLAVPTFFFSETDIVNLLTDMHMSPLKTARRHRLSTAWMPWRKRVRKILGTESRNQSATFVSIYSFVS